jgi:hypothetical protein
MVYPKHYYAEQMWLGKQGPTALFMAAQGRLKTCSYSGHLLKVNPWDEGKGFYANPQ